MKKDEQNKKKNRTPIEQQEAAVRTNAKMRLRFTNISKPENSEENITKQQTKNQYR